MIAGSEASAYTAIMRQSRPWWRLPIRRLGASGSILLVAAGLAAATDAARPLQASFQRVLAADLGFTAGDMADLGRSKLVSRTLPSNNSREIAVVGAVRVESSAERLVDRVRDIVRFKRGPEVLQIGRFSDPPVESDLAGLTVTETDARFRSCRVGDCDVRLSAAAIGRIGRSVDWTAADAEARAVAVFKAILLEDVRDYVSGGAGRMLQYDDDKEPVLPVRDFAGLLESSPYVKHMAPGLPEHLLEYPRAPLAGAEDFLYWSKERFGFDPFITVTHVTIAKDPDGAYVITSKDVYSSRYVDASLGVTIASAEPGNADAFYLVYVNRSRARAIGGLFNGLRRSVVQRRAKGSLEQNLRQTKMRIERGL